MFAAAPQLRIAAHVPVPHGVGEGVGAGVGGVLGEKVGASVGAGVGNLVSTAMVQEALTSMMQLSISA